MVIFVQISGWSTGLNIDGAACVQKGAICKNETKSEKNVGVEKKSVLNGPTLLSGNLQ